MLQSIRDRLSGPIVWFVIGLICIPFAFWGIESFRGGSTDPVVATVGDHDITQAEFRQGYEQRYQQLQQMLGENFNPGIIDQARFRQNVLDDMIQEQLLRQYVQKAGYRASDAAVFNYLSSVPAFQQDGKFSAQQYRDLLQRRGLQPQRFESQLRESLVIDQLREAIAESAFVTDDEALLSRRIAGQTRDVGLAVLPLAAFQRDAQVTDAEIAERYEANKSAYMAPERLRIAYVDLALDKLPKAENPGEAVLKVAYDAEKDSRFTSSEERRASHLLIAFGADKSASKARIEKLAEQIKAGASFADLTKQNSDDTGSKASGGDLGYIKRGMMTKSFEDALFSLKAAGEISGVVETEFGFHLIKLDELKTPTVRSFEDPAVQAELLDVYQARETQKRFQELSDKLEQLAFENPTSLEPVAQALGLKVESSDWFTRAGGSGLLAEDAVKTAAFSAEVLTDNENSKPLAVGAGRVVVLRKSEYEAPRQRALTEVRDGIAAELQLAKAKAAAGAKATQLVEALKQGQSLDAAAGAHGAELKPDAVLTRNATQPERVIVDTAFKLPRPVEGKVSAAQLTLANGDLAVILLRKVDEPTTATLAPTESAQLRDAVAGAEYAAMRKALEKEFKVEIKNPPADPNAAAAGEEPAP